MCISERRVPLGTLQRSGEDKKIARVSCKDLRGILLNASQKGFLEAPKEVPAGQPVRYGRGGKALANLVKACSWNLQRWRPCWSDSVYV